MNQRKKEHQTAIVNQSGRENHHPPVNQLAQENQSILVNQNNEENNSEKSEGTLSFTFLILFTQCIR